MSKPLFCIWEKDLEQKRESALEKLELNSERAIPIFDEATQTIANMINVPVAILGFTLKQEYFFKSAYGLSNLGLMNNLASNRKIAREQAFATNVIDSANYLMVDDVFNHAFFSQSDLCQLYGVSAYLGVPLITSEGICIGCLEAIDTQTRQFSTKEINYLMITARWCMAEYERNRLLHQLESAAEQKAVLPSANKITTMTVTPQDNVPSSLSSPVLGNIPSPYVRQLTFLLLRKLTGKLSIPLTSVIGMSSVLKQEIYGKLTSKQLEYINIIHDSGQDVSTLIDEISQLTNLENQLKIELTPVDLENLGLQVINNLKSVAENREQTLRLSIEPGQKIWRLDREKLKKTLYYLLIAIIESSRSGGEINIHVSQRSEQLRINCSINHPWLGDGISLEKVNLYREVLKYSKGEPLISKDEYSLSAKIEKQNLDYDLICLLFSAYLATVQQGNIALRGSVESGHRFTISIPLNYLPEPDDF